ncbi:metallophosphoesterase [Plantactinospora sp. GCM10030261]|uniref:metallophosphoesterase n=1 Tax=Plantactinospora sp. GCM10030261 TaxID=3273420 RepID=UPI00360BBA96
MAAVLFLAIVLLVPTLVHLYLWKRLVRDTTRPGRWRRAGGVLMVTLALLIPATLAGTRAGLYWLAWPGYLWLAVMFYLLVLLVVAELPMLVIRRLVRRRAAGVPAREPVQADRPTEAGDPVAVLAGPGAERAAGTNASAGPAPAVGPGSGGRVPPDGATGSPSSTTVPPAEPGHDPGRRLLLARSLAIVAGLTATGVTGYGVAVAKGPPRLNRVQIPLAKLPRRMDGMRIALVSDIHLGPLSGRPHAERVVAAINRVDADLVAVVGDLVDGSVAELGPAAAPLRDLRSRYGSFFVTGNHEYYSGVAEWVAEVDRLGLRVLQNRRREIVTPGGVLDLAGVNDVSAEEFGGTGVEAGPDYDAALGGRDPDRPVVLLAHQPVAVHEAARRGVDLQLSGHTHGGQIVPFNLLVGLEQPVVSGHATIDGTQVVVTNGAGFWGPPVRVGAPPQVTLVELRSA